MTQFDATYGDSRQPNARKPDLGPAQTPQEALANLVASAHQSSDGRSASGRTASSAFKRDGFAELQRTSQAIDKMFLGGRHTGGDANKNPIVIAADVMAELEQAIAQLHRSCVRLRVVGTERITKDERLRADLDRITQLADGGLGSAIQAGRHLEDERDQARAQAEELQRQLKSVAEVTRQQLEQSYEAQLQHLREQLLTMQQACDAQAKTIQQQHERMHQLEVASQSQQEDLQYQARATMLEERLRGTQQTAEAQAKTIRQQHDRIQDLQAEVDRMYRAPKPVIIRRSDG